ncbi:amino acid ABC transporter substrate-binding protein [Saccharospirillum salsuginis]|uniref:Amino acid ABC transporter substrate-binding protein n=3 Tax=Saccharospirillum salsuginis TaxID=418750 RepID=A0A918KC11_9GAMM|nr:amino acid ABC transporter substrate-binding protein [Saccharospirillum salsuginis]
MESKMFKTLTSTAAATALSLTMVATGAQAGETVDSVRDKGYVQCGVNTALAGFSAATGGEWEGLDVDVCRAVAAAMFGDADAVRFTPLTAAQRFTALQSGEVDVLSRNTTWTTTRDTSLGLNFAGINYYDGQGFMVRKDLGVTSAKQLSGAAICVEPGTTTELNLADYFRANNMDFEPVVIENTTEVTAAFFSGRCDVYTTDASGLASARNVSAENPEDYVILPEIISKEPLGPVVRHGDDEWLDIVKWSHIAMIQAEEFGITSDNVDDMMDTDNPGIKRFLGVTPGMGEALGLDEKWAYNIVKQVGNYGESYQRNVTEKLGLERGLNALWTDGGLMYAFPIR